MISKETIDEIQKKVSIVDIVSQYAEVKHKGGAYVACCPFHNEKTPSFHMSIEKGVYHCFGCGASGNIFSFLMKISGISFSDAVIELANKFNIEIKYTNEKSQDNSKEKESLYKVNALATRYFNQSLVKNYVLLEPYLIKRNITKDIIKNFHIGFSPREWSGLFKFLKDAGVPEKIMELSGLFYRNKVGEFYDAFRGRLIFPVLIMQKKIAGFGGRIIPSIATKEELENSPKYLNSRETLIYEKSRILYNFFNAREIIKKEKCLFLVEGYMDVVGLSKVGINNVIATCGTALTLDHATKIEALNVDVFVMFDADNAGYNAASKAFEIFLNTKINARAIFLPNGEDPDSLAQKQGADTLKFLKSLKTISLLEAYFKKLLREEGIISIKEASPTIKEKISDKIMETISRIKNEVKLIEIIKEASFILQIPVEILNKLLRKYRSKVVYFNDIKKGSEKEGENKKIKILSLPGIDREIISVVLKDFNFLTDILLNPLLCKSLLPYTLEFLTFLDDILKNDSKTDIKKMRLKDFILSYGEDYLSLWKELRRDTNKFNPQSAYEQCLDVLKKIERNTLVKELEENIQLTKDDAERLTLINKLFEIRKLQQ